MTWKVTLIFKLGGLNGFPDVGFSETFYVSASSPQQAITRGTTLAQVRAPMLCTGQYIVAIRVTQVGAKGVGITQFEQGLQGTWPTPDYPHVGAWLEILTVEGPKRQFIMRGLADNMTVGQTYQWQANFQTQLDTYIQTLTSTPWQILGRTRPLSYQPVVAVDGSGNVTAGGAVVTGINQQVKFFRTKTAAGYPVKRVYTVIGFTSPTVFQVSNWPAGQTVTTGQIGLYTKQPYNIVNVLTQGTRERKPGKVFFQLRGRAPKRPALAA